MATNSFFYGGATAPSQSTTDQLLEEIDARLTEAEADAQAAQASAAQAADSATAAGEAADSVGILAANATTALETATAAAEQAQALSDSLQESLGTAATSAASAASSASSASASATQASTDAATATSAASSVTTAATTASDAAATATSQATSAAASASSAAASASSVDTLVDSAVTAASQASDSATTATGAASSATTSEIAAATHASTATDAASQAASSASEAASSASSASTSATSAQAAADTATQIAEDLSSSAGVTSFNTRNGAVTLGSLDITGALGFTPYDAANPSGYLSAITGAQVNTALGFTPISGITSGMVNTALGYTPYNATNPDGYVTALTAPVKKVNGKTGNVIFVAADLNTIYGFTPYDSANPAGYLTATTDAVKSVFGRTGVVTLASADVTGALGFTPLNATAYTAADVLAKLVTVDGSGSGLDADTTRGFAPTTAATATTLALRDSGGQLVATNFVGNLLVPVGSFSLLGNSTSFATRTSGTAVGAALQVQGNTFGTSSGMFARFTNDTSGPNLFLAKSRGAIGAHTAVASGDVLGVLSFGGSDGTNIVEAARIIGVATSAATTDSLTARLDFQVNLGGSVAPTSMLRLDASGFYPSNNNLRDLGLSTNVWANVWATKVNGAAMTASGARWGVLAAVASDGVMEIGKVIDFHSATTDASDYGWRMDITSGSFVFSSSTQASISTLGPTGDLSVAGSVTAPRVACGYDSGIASSVNAGNWFRSSGQTGWINDTYGGGIYMLDATWVRVYNNKAFYTAGLIRSDASLQVGASGAAFLADSSGAVTTSGRFLTSLDTASYISKPDTTAGYTGLLLQDQAGVRKFEAIFLGSTHGAAYGAAAGTNVINSQTTLTFSIADVAKATLNSAGTFTAVELSATSDIRTKKDIAPVKDALAKLMTLTGVTFTRISTESRGVGLIAQDVQKVFPESIKEAEDERKTLSVDYGGLVGPIIEALRELSERIERLERA